MKADTLSLGPLETFDCEQGSPEWFQMRLGIPTASNFSNVIAGGTGKTRSVYMRKLAGELITSQPREDYRAASMDRGIAMESTIRSLYALQSGNEPQICGFMKRKFGSGYVGCSPDALIGDDGVLEIKTAAPHVLIEILDTDQVPTEHVAQCQGALLVSGRRFTDLAIGYEGMPLFRRRLERDDTYIQTLAASIDTFNRELAKMVERVVNYRSK